MSRNEVVETALCPECDRMFPEELIRSMCVDGDYVTTCPVCALRIRNAHHGLPANTPFTGTIAARMHEEALTWLRQAKKVDSEKRARRNA